MRQWTAAFARAGAGGGGKRREPGARPSAGFKMPLSNAEARL